MEKDFGIFDGLIEEFENYNNFYMSTQELKKKRAPKGHVTAYNGEFIKKEDVILINGRIFSKADEGKLFHHINNTYYLTGDPMLIHDNFTNKLNHKNNCSQAIVDIVQDTPIYGYSSEISPRMSTLLVTGITKTGDCLPAHNSKVFKKAGYILGNDGNFYQNEQIMRKCCPQRPKYYEFSRKNILPEVPIKSSTFLTTKGLKYTFGVEIETASGAVKPWQYNENNLNMKTVYDGSIKDDDGSVVGGEIVTGVLTGDSGMNQLLNICKTISKTHTVNRKCSIHVHVGGATFNPEFIVLAYLLAQKVEDDLFNMLPSTRRSNKYCRMMKKGIDLQKYFSNYEYMDAIDLGYKALYKRFLGKDVNKIDFKIGDRSAKHPGGKTCHHDTTSDRYCWMNLIPTTFDHAHNNYTVEFRNHSATLNYTKIKNWSIICMCLVAFIEEYGQEIIDKPSFTIEYIVAKILGKKGNELLNYIHTRKELFMGGDDENNEFAQHETNIKNIKEILCV